MDRMKTGMVSVIIPTYNRAAVISEAIQAVLNQTYSDLEVIVVSDGKQDQTRKVVESFKDRRINYYEIEHSGRPAIPRNFGINKSEGVYIAFCDDDDIWMPEKLRLQMEKARQDKGAGIIYTKCLLAKYGKNRVFPLRGREGYIFKDLFLAQNFIPSSSVLIKREVIEQVGVFDEDIRLKATEDFDLWLRIARDFKVGFVDKPLFIHRYSSDSISKGIIPEIKRYYLVACKLYKKNYIGLRLFIKGLFLLFCKRTILSICRR